MLELCIIEDGTVKLDRQFAGELERLHTEIIVTEKGIQLNLRSKRYMDELLSKFNIHESVLVTLESYKSNVGFLHVSSKEINDNVTITPQEVSGLKNGILGEGVYAIGAAHFDHETPLYNALRNKVLKDHLKEGVVHHCIRTSIFTFSGRMKEIIRGRGLEGFFWLDAKTIKQDFIQTIVDETIDVVYE